MSAYSQQLPFAGDLNTDLFDELWRRGGSPPLHDEGCTTRVVVQQFAPVFWWIVAAEEVVAEDVAEPVAEAAVETPAATAGTEEAAPAAPEEEAK